MKAGIMPMHIWLPSAHAQAPSHVSAVMSGVLLKTGVYGIVRVSTFYPEIPLGWAMFVLAMGTITGIFGIAFAIGQQDIKRVLAYSSIENIGIITIALGLALVGRATDQPQWALLGICGMVLHVWNHALFKSLLFFGAGSVIHGVGTREVELMGGLSKRMPATANCFLIGAVAIWAAAFERICVRDTDLPRLVSRGHNSHCDSRQCRSVCCSRFSARWRVGSSVLCQIVRTRVPRCSAQRTSGTRSRSWPMIGPMLALAVLCALIGVMPLFVAPLLDRMAADWGGPAVGELAIATAAPLQAISIVGGIIAVLLLSGMGFLRQRGIRRAPSGLTWDCGYAAPSSRMQYSSSSFAETLVKLFGWALQPKVQLPKWKACSPRIRTLTAR